MTGMRTFARMILRDDTSRGRHRPLKFPTMILGAMLLVAWSPAAHAQFCVGNLLSNGSFETHTGATNSIGDPIPSVWVRTSGEVGATTAFNPPDGNYVGYVWGTSSSSPGVMQQSVSATAGATYTFTFFSGTHNPAINPT